MGSDDKARSEDPDATRVDAGSARTELAHDPNPASPSRRVDIHSRVSDRFSLGTGEPESEAVHAALDVSKLVGAAERYESGRLLGSGGMGEVALQVDRNIGRAVAMKTLHDQSNQDGVRRFLRETRIQGQLEHPTIVPVYDLGIREGEELYFTMKRVRGHSLSRIIDAYRRGDSEITEQYSMRRLLTAFVQICMAVHYAHARGVIHRDIKPANVMLGPFGEVYLLDWGIARVLADSESEPSGDGTSMDAPVSKIHPDGEELTAQGDMVGTLAYMAPEQMHGQLEAIDARTDVFALGATLFELVTQTKFRDAHSYESLVVMALEGDSPRPSEYAENVAPELDEICLRATARDAGDRFASAAELASAIEGHLDGDRDRDLRAEVAAGHATRARELASGVSAEAAVRVGEGPEPGAHPRTLAMAEAVKALALEPENAAHQRLLVELVLESEGELPPEVQAEFDKEQALEFGRAMRMGTGGFAALALGVGGASLVGVKSWMTVSTTVVICVLAVAQLLRMAAPGRNRTWDTIVLGTLSALAFASTTTWLGPFIVAPSLAVAGAAMFASAASATQRWIYTSFMAVGTVLPTLLEYGGYWPRAFAFEQERIVLFARGISFPEVPTVLSVSAVALALVIVPAVLIGRVSDSLVDARRRVFAQAWYLRQLFPK